MLHLLLGIDRISLSDKLLEQLCFGDNIPENSRILIVPEQFSHEAERLLCQVGGETVSRYAEVLSLSRLAERVAATCGGAARAYLDQGGRILAMALAAEQISSRIKLFGAVLRKPEFLADVVAMVDEFQSCCLQPETLLEAASHAEGQFAQKLEELGLLYEAYLAVCANGKADPAGKMLWLRNMLVESDWAEKRSFYIDGFLDFTGAELDILEVLLYKSSDIWVSLTADSSRHVTRPVQDTARKLQRLAEKWGLKTEILSVSEYDGRDPAIAALLQGMFASGSPAVQTSEKITLGAFTSVEEECRFAVQQIKRLLAKGERCRNISLACTDTGLYEAPLRAALRTANLPFYFAGRDALLGKPIMNAVLSALMAAVGPMDYEDVSVYLKSGLPQLDRDSCDRLDCYAYLWNLRGNQWERPWELHPGGFGAIMTDEDRAKLLKLNEDKTVALGPLFRLRSGLQQAGDTGAMVVCFYDFLEELQLRQRLEQQANETGGQLGQELYQLYDILRQSLEQTWLIVGNTARTPDDFARLYRSILTQYHISTIPAGIDQVYVGALQDMRQRRTGHLLVLGASDGSFPTYKTGEGLLTEEERKKLLAQGVLLSPPKAEQMEHEMCRIFTSLSAATESIWLSYAGDQPAWLYRRAAAMFPQSVLGEKKEVFLDIPSYAAWRLRHEDNSEVSLPLLEQWEEKLRQLRDYDFKSLSEETVQGLYGKQLYLSASRIDKYAACRFAFFLAYGLKAEPRKQAKLDPAAFGTFVHEVLEKTVLRVKAEGSFWKISRQRLLEIAVEEIDAYAEVHFPQQAQRAAYLFNRSRAEILDIVMDLGEELKHSLFQPADCELEFSAKGPLPAIEVQGKHALCRVSGFVDRVDLYETDGKAYVRVVDYKTGHKDFDYTDILNGAGLQMLIYLFALKEYGGKHYGYDRLSPAGVLYMPARKEYSLTPPLPDDEEILNRHQEERRRRGLISSDRVVLAAMEEDPEQPRFMPYKAGKNGLEGNLADCKQMEQLERHVLRTLADLADSIVSGDVRPNPVVRGQDSSCRFCDYQSVCHGDLCAHDVRPMAATTAAKFWEKLEEKENDHG